MYINRILFRYENKKRTMRCEITGGIDGVVNSHHALVAWRVPFGLVRLNRAGARFRQLRTRTRTGSSPRQ